MYLNEKQTNISTTNKRTKRTKKKNKQSTHTKQTDFFRRKKERIEKLTQKIVLKQQQLYLPIKKEIMKNSGT